MRDSQNATGLVFLNNRYQDPATGVFISVDPLVAKTGMPYLYAKGNPSTLSDPSGLMSADAASNWASLGYTCSGSEHGADCGMTSVAWDLIGPTLPGQRRAEPPSNSVVAEDPASPDEPSRTVQEQVRLMKETLTGLASKDVEGWTSGVCGSADVGLIWSGEVQGCVVTDSDGVSVISFTGDGFGSPSLGLSAGPFSSNGDVKDLRGPTICFGASISAGQGSVCGSIQYEQGDSLWHFTGTASLYVGVTLDTTIVTQGEVHVLYGQTSGFQLISYDWFKPWTWGWIG